jgi:nucleoside-diphosphate-sugar epimerase
LGLRLVKFFSKNGWNVKALVRNSHLYESQDNIRYLEYNLRNSIDKAILKDTDYLVHTAYIKFDRKNPDAIDVNINAAYRLLSVSRMQKVRKNVFISSMSAHEGAISSYGRQKLFIEQLFNQSSDVSLRPGLIIGNGGIVKTMTTFMQHKHLVPLVGGGHQPLQIVDVDDLVIAIEQAIINDLSGVLTVATTQVYSYKIFYKSLAKHLHIRIFLIPIPFSLLLLAMRFADLLHLPLSINQDNVLGLKKLTARDSSSDLQKLGIQLNDLETSLQKVNPF